MAASVISNLLVVTASVGVMGLLVCLLPVPRLARTGMCLLTVLAGLAWGVDQVRLAARSDAAPLAMTRLSAAM